MAATKNRVTVKDVAKKANVTAQTVSRVMHSKGYVSQKTRERVLDAVKELNYIPSYAAKALRSGMAKSIALIFDSLRNYYFAIMIDYLRVEIAKHGYSLQLLFSDIPLVSEDTYRKAISHGAVAVVSFLEGASGLGEAVHDCGVPLIILGRSTTDSGLDYITTDDERGGQLAAEKLISAGCTKFVYVMLGQDMSCVLERGHGFAETLAQHGFSYTEYNTTTHDLEKISEVYDLSDPRLGVFCFNDVFAFTVLKKMNTFAKHQRAKLVGYDNIQQDVVLPVNITTIAPDKQKFTQFILAKLQQRLKDGVRLAEHQPVILFEGETA